MKVILILLATVNLVLCDQPFDDVLQLVGQAGYVGESHLTETEDGYILKVHRVLAKNGPSQRFPVFLMHGLIATSADYVMTGQKSALAYFLADNGYDVWMGNARGSKHSMNHRHLSTDSPEFWTFSWNEIGHYDVPAMIDLVLNKTGAPKTFYVGHSQGTTSFLVFMSTRPQYNEKIIQSHLFAPAGFMKHIPHPAIFTLINEVRNGFFRDYKYVNLGTILTLGSPLSRFLCSIRQRSTLAVCESLIFAIAGPNKYQKELDSTILRDITNHVSPRFSVMQLVHYAQLYISGKFQTFDHRWKYFGQKNASAPVEYPLENIRVPVHIYVGTEDALISIIDVEHLMTRLPNVKTYKVIKNWNHVDFTYGRNARKVLYKEVLQKFREIS